MGAAGARRSMSPTPSSSSRASPMSRRRWRGSLTRQRAIRARTREGVAAGSAARSGSRGKDQSKRFRDRVACEQACPGQHLVEHHAKRPDVRALVDRLPARLLRRHVGGRAENHARLRHGRRRDAWESSRASADASAPAGVDRFRQTEVEHLHRAVGADLDVRGLEIAVNDALLVRRFERVGNLPRDRERLVDRERPRAMRCERSSPSTSSITRAVTPPLSSMP